MCVLVEELPHDSRYYRKVRGGVELTITEDLLWDIRDICMAAAYWSSVGGLKGMKQAAANKLASDAPEPTRKPGVQPDEDKPKFLNARELHTLFG